MCRKPFKSTKGLLSSETYTGGLVVMNFFKNFCNCFLCDGFRSDDGFVSDTKNLYFRTLFLYKKYPHFLCSPVESRQLILTTFKDLVIAFKLLEKRTTPS